MGTRATYLFKVKHNFEGKKKTNDYGLIYTQFDGYPEGKPYDIIEYINSGKMVNGIGNDPGLVFNGMGCLMASIVAKFKIEAGGLYIIPIQHRGSSGEDYLYTFVFDWSAWNLTVIVHRNGTKKKKIFEGSLPKYLETFKK